MGRLLVRNRRPGECERGLQDPAALQLLAQHEPDVREAARRAFHRPHLHVERELHVLTAPGLLEPHPIRQPLPQPGMAEPRAVDAATGRRPVLRLQPGVDPGEHRRRPLPHRRPEDLREVSVRLQILMITRLLSATVAALILTACNSQPAVPPPAAIVERSHMTMGTELRLTAVAQQTSERSGLLSREAVAVDETRILAAFESAFKEVDHLDAVMS